MLVTAVGVSFINIIATKQSFAEDSIWSGQALSKRPDHMSVHLKGKDQVMAFQI